MSFLPVYESLADKVRHIYLTYDENNRITPHFHNSMEIVFVNRGDFHVIISGEEKTLHEGEIAVSDSYDVHNYIQIGDAAVYIAVIAQQFLRDFREANDKTFERFLPACDGTKEIFEFVKSAYENGVQRNEMLSQGFVTYLIGLLTYYYPCTRARCDNHDRGVQILSYIDEHFTENLTLPSVAAHFGYTPNYFSSIFGKYTGMGFRNYVNMLRIYKSLSMNDGTRKISEIASLVGFDSMNSYYRALKKYNGMGGGNLI